MDSTKGAVHSKNNSVIYKPITNDKCRQSIMTYFAARNLRCEHVIWGKGRGGSTGGTGGRGTAPGEGEVVWGSATVPLDRVLLHTSYRLSTVNIPLSVTVWP